MTAKTVLIFTVIVAVLAVLAIAMTIRAGVKGKGTFTKGRTVGTVLLSLLLIIIVGANGAIYNFNNIIDIYFNKINMDSPEIKQARDDAKDLTEEEALQLVDNIFEYYKDEAELGEKLSLMIERIGVESFIERVKLR